jgi:anti-sigma B factor antagonist
MSGSARLFQVTTDRADGGVVVAATGEIDMSTSPQLRAALRDPQASAPAVVLDLRAVTFMDSSGLGVIVGQHKRAREEGYRFAVAVDGAPEVRRILELSGLVGVLHVVDAPDDALGAG